MEVIRCIHKKLSNYIVYEVINHINNMNKFLKLSGLGIQMGVIIYLFSYLGGELDSYFKTESKTYTLILVILGFLLSLYSLMVQLNKMNKDE